MPNAATRSSTERVATPYTKASITAVARERAHKATVQREYGRHDERCWFRGGSVLRRFGQVRLRGLSGQALCSASVRGLSSILVGVGHDVVVS